MDELGKSNQSSSHRCKRFLTARHQTQCEKTWNYKDEEDSRMCLSLESIKVMKNRSKAARVICTCWDRQYRIRRSPTWLVLSLWYPRKECPECLAAGHVRWSYLVNRKIFEWLITSVHFDDEWRVFIVLNGKIGGWWHGFAADGRGWQVRVAGTATKALVRRQRKNARIEPMFMSNRIEFTEREQIKTH